MVKEWRAVLVLAAMAMVVVVAIPSGSGDGESDQPDDAAGAPAVEVEVAEPIPTTVAPPVSTTTPIPVRLSARTLMGSTPWRGVSPLARRETPKADFRRRLVPSSWDVLDSAGVLFDPGELTLDFHEGVAGERLDWVGVSNGCVTNGWLIEWLEGDGDIGLMRRVEERTVALESESCPDAAVDWPFPKGWVRVSFDGDQLILGRQRTDLLAVRTDRAPVNPAQLSVSNTTTRMQMLNVRFDVGPAEHTSPRVPLLLIEEGAPDWIHTFDGCRRRSSWIREWTEEGFIAESAAQPMSTRRPVLNVAECSDSVVATQWLHDGVVEVVATADGFELRQDGRTLELRTN